MTISKRVSAILLGLAILPLTSARPALADDSDEGFRGTRVRGVGLFVGGELQIREAVTKPKSGSDAAPTETSEGAGALTFTAQYSDVIVEPTEEGRTLHSVREYLVSGTGAVGGTLPEVEGEDGEEHYGADARVRATLIGAYFGALREDGGCRLFMEAAVKGEAHYRKNPMRANEALGSIALAPLGLFCANENFILKLAPEGEILAKTDETLGSGIGGRFRLGSKDVFLEVEGGTRGLERNNLKSQSNWGQGSLNLALIEDSLTLRTFVAVNHDKSSIIDESGETTGTKHVTGQAFGAGLGGVF